MFAFRKRNAPAGQKVTNPSYSRASRPAISARALPETLGELIFPRTRVVSHVLSISRLRSPKFASVFLERKPIPADGRRKKKQKHKFRTSRVPAEIPFRRRRDCCSPGWTVKRVDDTFSTRDESTVGISRLRIARVSSPLGSDFFLRSCCFL